jgi:nonsense-mediated mRNA decay protein 3
MQLTKFCPRCGQETETLYGDQKKLCASCFPEKNDLLDVPNEVEVVYCSVCGRMKDGREWVEEYTVEEQLGVRFSEFNRDDIKMSLQYWEEDEDTIVRVHVEKGQIRDHYDTDVEFQKEQCPTCSKFNGGFYKVKMQLRGDAELGEITNEIADKAAEVTNKNRKNFLANIDKHDHGYDVFMSTEDMAKEILDLLRAKYAPEIKRSYELMGEEDGQEVYRNVISVRINKTKTE